MKARTLCIVLLIAFLVMNLVLVAGYFLLRSPPAPLATGRTARGPVLLTAPEGERFVGEQLRFLRLDPDGVWSATNIVCINLYHTEGRAFRLRGEVRLAPPGEFPAHGDYPDGFALFFREWDSLHRYSLRTRGVEVKRRRTGNGNERAIVQAATFGPPQFHTWLPFSAEVSQEKILFSLGNQSGVLPGPLDLDGANKIGQTPGTMLRQVELEILDDNPTQ